jgi:hypothetical protein
VLKGVKRDLSTPVDSTSQTVYLYCAIPRLNGTLIPRCVGGVYPCKVKACGHKEISEVGGGAAQKGGASAVLSANQCIISQSGKGSAE